MAQAEVAQQDLTALTDFRLGMIEDFDRHITPDLLSDLGQAYSACKFVLETGPSHRLLDLLDTRALDVVVAAEFDAVRHGDTVEVHPLINDPYIAAVPKGAVAAGADTLAALGDLPLILNGVMDPLTTAHGPNESMHLGVFKKAVAANVYLYDELSRLPR